MLDVTYELDRLCPAEVLRVAQGLEVVRTKKYKSWLNMAESELRVLTRQCLSRRFATPREVADQAAAWGVRHTRKPLGVDWQFTTEGVWIKLKHLLPKMGG